MAANSCSLAAAGALTQFYFQFQADPLHDLVKPFVELPGMRICRFTQVLKKLRRDFFAGQDGRRRLGRRAFHRDRAGGREPPLPVALPDLSPQLVQSSGGNSMPQIFCASVNWTPDFIEALVLSLALTQTTFALATLPRDGVFNQNLRADDQLRGTSRASRRAC